MLGPDCVLVRRTPQGYRSIGASEAGRLQVLLLGDDKEPGWLFDQCRRIADALDRGELALAQILGLYIPIDDLGSRQLTCLAAAGFIKANFDSGEPRVPKGDPRGGQWTTGGGGGVAVAAEGAGDGGSGDSGAGAGVSFGGEPTAVVSAEDGDSNSGDDSGAALSFEWGDVWNEPSPGDGSSGTSGGSRAPASTSDADIGSPAIPARMTIPPRPPSGSLLGALTEEQLASLMRLAARMSAPTAFLGILFIPGNSGLISEGIFEQSPDLFYRYDRDTGVLHIWRGDGWGAGSLLGEARIDIEARFRDVGGRAIARLLPDNSIIVDPDTLAGYRTQRWPALAPATAMPHAANDNEPSPRVAIDNDPKLCPAPSRDHQGARDKDIAYQQYVSWLINGRALGKDLAINLFNPSSGKFVAFDDCRNSDGTMIDAKGTGYLEMLEKDSLFPWKGAELKMLKQARSQEEAAGPRPIEWHFAERDVAEYVRNLFVREQSTIKIIYTPWMRIIR